VTGMAAVAEELLQLLACDVVLLGVLHSSAKAQPFFSLIGRCSARAEGRAVNLTAMMSHWNGGGHPGAAAASIKLRTPDRETLQRVGDATQTPSPSAEGDDDDDAALDEAYWVMHQAVSMLVKQIPDQVCASDLMVGIEEACVCRPNDTMEDALALMNQRGKRAVPVLADDDTLVGYVKYRDPIKAVGAGKGQQQVKAWMRRELLSVAPNTPFTDMEAMLLEGDTGHLHVVDDANRLIGLVSRTDLLRHYALYKGLDDLAPGRVQSGRPRL